MDISVCAIWMRYLANLIPEFFGAPGCVSSRNVFTMRPTGGGACGSRVPLPKDGDLEKA